MISTVILTGNLTFHETEQYFTIVTTNASFCLFICAFVFASNSGHFGINEFLLFFTLLLLLNYFLFNSFLFLQKSPPHPPLPLRGPRATETRITRLLSDGPPAWFICIFYLSYVLHNQCYAVDAYASILLCKAQQFWLKGVKAIYSKVPSFLIHTLYVAYEIIESACLKHSGKKVFNETRNLGKK